MPNREILETYPLYRKLAMSVPRTLNEIPKPAIKMNCPICQTEQTFLMNNEYYMGRPYSNFPSDGMVVQAEYLCASCQSFERVFVIKIADDRSNIMKVGQYPSWDIKGDRNVERLLGDHRTYLTRGMICESQGYGIAAFAYYRRIVEETIDTLLDEVSQLLNGDELKRYEAALADTKKTRITADKIDLVKDLMPAVLRPEGMNPLKTLHETLSEGLHAESDDDCMKSAEIVRQILIFLATQIATAADAKKSFTTGMRALLDQKSRKISS